MYGAEKLEKATRWLQKVETLRCKLQKRTGRVLDTAASLEILGCKMGMLGCCHLCFLLYKSDFAEFPHKEIERKIFI